MLQVIDIEWDTWIVFVQNPASFWIGRIVAHAQCQKGVNRIPDLVNLPPLGVNAR
jgi:hypothetical protein